jgi:hypothetical protein
MRELPVPEVLSSFNRLAELPSRLMTQSALEITENESMVPLVKEKFRAELSVNRLWGPEDKLFLWQESTIITKSERRMLLIMHPLI